jgi:carbamoylphosphate synthase small subunit
MIKAVVREMNNIGLKAFKLVSRDLDELLRLQQQAIDSKEDFNVQRYVRLADVSKIAESLHKLTGSSGAKEMVLRLEVGEKQKSLSDLSDEELARIDYQAQTGQADVTDAEYEVVE